MRDTASQGSLIQKGWSAIHSRLSIFIALVLFALTGCAKPNQANVLLRKENQDLKEQVAQLRRETDMDRELIAGLRARPTTIPSLPPDELEKLFTTHAINFGRLTGGYNVDSEPFDAGLRIYIVPVDGENQLLKAAGSFVI